MAMFQSDAERLRKENLKRMEDKRLRFAQEMEAKGFRPERMFFCSREDGSFAALARHEGRFALIDAPKFGEEGEFTLDLMDELSYDREEVFEKGTGLNGAFGFGTKGARGFNLFIRNSDGLYVKLPVVFGRNSWLEATYKKNPLLKTKRRRGDANVMWDFVPIDSQSLRKIEALLAERYLNGATPGASTRPNAKSPAEAFYDRLRAAVEAENLNRYTKLNLGTLSEEAHSLNILRHPNGRCDLSYYAEPGTPMFQDENLTEVQATEKCLSFLRDQKRTAEYYQSH